MRVGCCCFVSTSPSASRSGCHWVAFTSEISCYFVPCFQLRCICVSRLSVVPVFAVNRSLWAHLLLSPCLCPSQSGLYSVILHGLYSSIGGFIFPFFFSGCPFCPLCIFSLDCLLLFSFSHWFIYAYFLHCFVLASDQQGVQYSDFFHWSALLSSLWFAWNNNKRVDNYVRNH